MFTTIIRQLAMASIESPVMKSKFRGSLLGSLLGDCLGAPYEGDTISAGDKITIQKYFDKLEDPTLRAPYRPYTDDTAMMKSVAKFLIDKPEPDFTFLAKLFVKEYFTDPNRGYGGNIVDVFQKLRTSKFQDVFKPASEQFSGSGSYGNGGAMRVCPIPLYFNGNYKLMIDTASKATKLTHTNDLGVFGALLQCIAVHQALMCDPNEKINVQQFCDQLCDKMKDIEKCDESDEDGLGDIGCPYQDKLQTVKHILTKKYNDELDDDVIFRLGNNISAYDSVPTAIYCFLRAQNEIPTVQTANVFRRAIQYAITLGGDTDTIACMTGALAGAYLGEEAINGNLAKQCEYHKELIEMADCLFEASEGSK